MRVSSVELTHDGVAGYKYAAAGEAQCLRPSRCTRFNDAILKPCIRENMSQPSLPVAGFDPFAGAAISR